jgi:hypothetical protein
MSLFSNLSLNRDIGGENLIKITLVNVGITELARFSQLPHPSLLLGNNIL